MSKKEVAKTQTTAVVEINDSEFDNLEPGQSLTANDIMIPRILSYPCHERNVEGTLGNTHHGFSLSGESGLERWHSPFLPDCEEGEVHVV